MGLINVWMNEWMVQLLQKNSMEVPASKCSSSGNRFCLFFTISARKQPNNTQVTQPGPDKKPFNVWCSHVTLITSRLSRFFHLDSGNVERVTSVSPSCSGESYSIISSLVSSSSVTSTSLNWNRQEKNQPTLGKIYSKDSEAWVLQRHQEHLGNYFFKAKFQVPWCTESKTASVKTHHEEHACSYRQWWECSFQSILH